MQLRKSPGFTLVFFILSVALSACSEQPAAEAADLNGNQAVVDERAGDPDNSIRESIKQDCITCGEVRSITAVTEEGESTGVGAALGAIVGGLAGNQVGGGSGKKIATVAGAVGGAVAGNTIEKKRGTETMYDVRIEMENGSEQTIRVPDATGISVGSDVTVEGNQIYLR
jgi:outer membrane lipoprotein SlyB